MTGTTNTSERERRAQDIPPGVEVQSDVTGSRGKVPAVLQARARDRANETVRRLAEAIRQLETRDEPVPLKTVNQVSGLDPKTTYRNPEARASRHTARTSKPDANARRPSGSGVGVGAAGGLPTTTQMPHRPPSLPRRDRTMDPLLALPKGQLLARLEAVLAARDEACRERAELEARYTALLQEHKGCTQRQQDWAGGHIKRAGERRR